MLASDLIIRGRRVVLPDTVVPASIRVDDGRIVSIDAYNEMSADCEVVDAGEQAVVMPGLVDTHVHINSPGRTEWEGFETATHAAAAGGITTLVDMPLNSIPPTTSLAGFNAKLQTAKNNCYVDVGFWGGVVPGNTGELAGLFAAGVVGFKCFLVPSGVDEFPHVTEGDLRKAMPELTRLGALLIVHAELPGPINTAAISTCHSETHEISGEINPKFGPTSYQTFLASRPRAAENEAVELMIRLSREFGTRVHIVHLSSADSLPMLRDAQRAGVRISAETCPHYLHFASEDIPDGATEFKCCPPIRERDNREDLWMALAEGTIDIVVSDHSPCPGNMKLRETGDFLNAWGGIASLQLRLPVVWTEARRRGFSLLELTKWLCSGPAGLVDMDRLKGSIVVGADADLLIWNPGQEFLVESEKLHHRHKITPYQGETLSGVVEKTFLRGRKIYDKGEFRLEPSGVMLLGKG